MKRMVYILLTCLWWSVASVTAQPYERLHVQTDKDFYLAGEKMYLGVWGMDDKHNSLDMSRVAYIELLGDAYNSVQVKVQLDNAQGNAVIDLPYTLSSGVYELVAYTRWMRNEGESVFFRKPIAVFNSLRYSPTLDQVQFVDEATPAQVRSVTQDNIRVKTDHKIFGTRSKVSIVVDGLQEDVRYSLSVVKTGSLFCENQLEERHFPKKDHEEKMAELEGMIIEARFVPWGDNKEFMRPNLSVKGKNMNYYAGQITNNGTIYFYTPSLPDVKEMFAGVEGDGQLEMVSPFIATPPSKLRAVRLHKDQEQELMERCMQIQSARFYPTDSIKKELSATFYNYKPRWSFDLDEYKRFPTFEETFLEFITGVSTMTKGEKKLITIFDEVSGASNNGNTLVLLDGVTIMNHQDLLSYNPYFVKWVDVYVGKYIFGEQVYEGIVSFRTPNHWMPSFQLSGNSVIVEYEGVLSKQVYEHPTWSQSSCPDLRHTLYWNPNVTVNDCQLECWTSDMCGTYIVKVEGMTKEGKFVSGTTSFQVEEEH